MTKKTEEVQAQVDSGDLPTIFIQFAGLNDARFNVATNGTVTQTQWHAATIHMLGMSLRNVFHVADQIELQEKQKQAELASLMQTIKK